MRAVTLLRAGESLPFTFDRGSNSISGWTCTISVKQFPSQADTIFSINRVIPPVNNQWPGFLTQSETSGLTAFSKPYYLIAILRNTTTDEEESIEVRFKIAPAFASS